MIENYLIEKYFFKYNEILNRTFIKENQNDSNFELLKSYKLNSIKRELNNRGINATQSDLKCLLESDFVPKFNPIKDYFNNLPDWDGQTDYIKMLTNTIKTTSQDDFEWAFKKWIVAMVACGINDEITNQTVLILTGGQGLGKTTWLKNLMPEELKDYYFSGNINPNNKDTTLLMSDKLMINLDELASLNKKQIEAFKEMITKTTITERRAYSHYAEDYIRRASFVGSSNHNEILMDVTGNRRFLCFETTEIQYQHNVDMDKVYSQVVSLIKEGVFKFYFEKEDILRLEENNKMFLQSSEEEDWIDELFEIPMDIDSVEFMNSSDIVSYIKAQKQLYQRLDIQLIGKIMTSKGFEKKKIKGISKYIVSKKLKG
jgi:predicted P-loop ATPase